MAAEKLCGLTHIQYRTISFQECRNVQQFQDDGLSWQLHIVHQTFVENDSLRVDT